MKSKLPYLTDEHLKAIAHVSIRSAQLDHMLEFLVFELLNPKTRTAEKLLKSTNSHNQVDLIKSMLLDRYPWYADDIEEFTSFIKTTRTNRNDIIHHLWGKTDESGAAKVASYRPFREGKEKSLTADQVWAVSDDLLEATHKIIQLGDWVDRDRPPSPSRLANRLQQGSSPWPLARGPQAQPLTLGSLGLLGQTSNDEPPEDTEPQE